MTTSTSDRLRRAARTTTAGVRPLVARRASADRGLLLLSTALLAVTVALCLALPRLLGGAADAALREAVVDAGPRADLVVTVPAGDVEDGADTAAAVAALAESSRDGLPGTVAGVTAAPVTAVLTRGATTPVGDAQLFTRVAHVGGDGATVTWLDGRAPAVSPEGAAALAAAAAADEAADADGADGADGADSADGADGTDGSAEGPDRPEVRAVVEVGVSAASAAAYGVDLGDRIEVRAPSSTPLDALVVGVFEADHPDAAPWRAFPDLLGPLAAPTDEQEGSLALLLTDDSLPDLLAALEPSGAVATVRVPIAAERLTTTGSARLGRTVAGLVADPESLSGAAGRTADVTSGLVVVLDEAAARLRGATAQASMLVVGLAVVGTLVLVLAARLLTTRRTPLLVAERARGASVASTVVRALAESVPAALVAAMAGTAVAVLVVPGSTWTWWPAAAVTAVTALAPAVLAGLVAAGAWTGRRQPANRQDRARLASHRRARRLVAEAALVAVALAALVSVRGRGLLQTTTGGVDLLLSATPVLLAAAATVLAARALPPVLRAVTRSAARRRGVVGLVGAARASQATGTAVPVLAVTIAVAVVVLSGTLAQAVVSGQQKAAALSVAADVRLGGPVPDEVVEALRGAAGVDAVATGAHLRSRTFAQGSGVKADVLAVDAVDYARTRDSAGLPVDTHLTDLARPDGAAGDPVPALVSPELLDVADLLPPSVMTLDAFVPLEVVGTTSEGSEDAPLVVVDRATLARLAPDATFAAVDVVWVAGDAAADAATRATDGLAGIDVETRSGWLQERRHGALEQGLLNAFVAAALVLAGYVVIALVLTVVATSPERGRTLAFLRTLGLDGRTARSVSLAELAPLAVVGAVAGSVIGTVVPWLLRDAIGLEQITGHPDATDVPVTGLPVLLAVTAVAVAVGFSVLVEHVVGRQARLGEVLRVGER